LNKQESLKLEKKVLSTLNLFLKNGDKIIAAISGGADSVFLLEMVSGKRRHLLPKRLFQVD